MGFDTNPFPKGDAYRHDLWQMLVARDIAAFVACHWSMVEGHLLADSFFGMHAHFLNNPDFWRLEFPTLEVYRDQWLRQARETDHAAFTEPLGRACSASPTCATSTCRAIAGAPQSSMARSRGLTAAPTASIGSVLFLQKGRGQVANSGLRR